MSSLDVYCFLFIFLLLYYYYYLMLQIENTRDFVISNRDERRALKLQVTALIAETKNLQAKKKELQLRLEGKKKLLVKAKEHESTVKKDLGKVNYDVV
jgi:hypothetical protein